MDWLLTFDLDDVSFETVRSVYRFNRYDIRRIVCDLEPTIKAKYARTLEKAFKEKDKLHYNRLAFRRRVRLTK